MGCRIILLSRKRPETTPVKSNVIIIHPSDNVAVTLTDIARGDTVCLPEAGELTAADDIPFSHKIALRDFVRGEEIIKYGEVIGQAGEAIGRGHWIHTHNLIVED
jgi:altronate dehydratase